MLLTELFLTEEMVHYDSNEEMLDAVKKIISSVKSYAKNKPIDIEMRPEIVYGNVHGVTLTDLFASKPGNGVGTDVMKYLIKLCDDAGFNLYTDAEGPRSHDYYVKLGFEKCDRNHQLVLYPNYDIAEYMMESVSSKHTT